RGRQYHSSPACHWTPHSANILAERWNSTASSSVPTLRDATFSTDTLELPLANNRKSKRKFWLWIGLAAVVIAAGLVVAVKASGNTTKFEPSQLAKAQRG